MRWLALVVVLAAGGCNGPAHRQAKSELNVATAANLTRAFAEVGQAFERETGIHVIYSLGATTQLAQQIEHGAPYDVFAAADTEHVDDLARKGFLIPETRSVYARGKLVLWVPARSVAIDHIEDLARPGVRNVAIANPQLAPYGRAAVESLKALRLWDGLQPRVVFAPNVLTATEYAATGNVDAAFTALALVYDRSGRRIEVPENLHSPISQAIAVVRSTPRLEQAHKFVAFVTGAKTREILKRYGYE